MATGETKTIEKTIDQTVVVKADQAQGFKLDVPRTAIGHIDVVDVDIVLTLKNGQKVVLAEGAINAIGGGQASIHFSDTAVSLQDALKDVGEVKIDANTPQVDSNTAQPTSVAETKSHPSTSVDAPDAPAVVTDQAGTNLSKMVQEGVSNQLTQVVKLDLNTKTDESASSFDVPPAAPSVNNERVTIITTSNAIPLQFSLLAQTGESVVGGIRYGSYGPTGEDASSSITTQAAPQIISDVAVGETVQANMLAGVSFIKLLHIEYTGNAIPSSLVLTGLPADVTIPGLTRAADGSYSINLATMASPLGAGQYDIPLQYLIQGANASNPVHENFHVTANLIGDLGVTVVNATASVVVVIKDVSQASDLNYIDPSTGVSALVLPAQGIGYDITAAGSNHITGGSSNDIIYSGTGNNVLDGAAGINTLSYSNAASGQVINLQTGLVTGSAGNDTVSNFQMVVGSAGSDNITGASSTLSMSGGSGGDDTFDGGHGGVAGAAETITGSATGNNTLTFANETVAGAAGGVIVNLVTGAVSGAYGVEVVSNIQNVIGGSGNDFLTGNSSTKTLSGGAGGDDTFDGGGANVSVTGSSNGTNTLTFSQAGGPVAVNLQTGTATGYGTETFTHIQSVIGSSYADLIVAAADSSAISGGTAGNDTIDASQTTAVISGSPTGNNVLTFANDVNGVNVNLQLQFYDGGYGAGSASNIQNIIGSTHNDVLIGALNTRSISGDGGNDVFDGGGGGSVSAPEQIIGGATGTNTLTFAAAGQGVNVNLQAGTATGYGVQNITNVQQVIGSAYNDTMVGASTTLSLSGGQGGIDLFDGGGGNETITGSSSGNNTVTYVNAANGVVVDLGSGVATGYGNEMLNAIQRIIGSSFADSLTGTSTTVSLSGGAGGADTFNPGGGGTVTAQETIAGSSSGNNTVTYATATTGVTVNLSTGLASGYGNQALSNIQKVVGSSFSDTLIGTKSTLSLSGGAGGDDTFDGGGGNVTITGSSTGNNTVTFANDMAGAVTVNLKTGTVTGAYGNETLSNIQNSVGSSFSDTLTAGATTRSLSGGAGGDDTFDGGGANVTIAGSATGVNTLTFANDAASGVTVNLQTGSVTGGYGTETVSNIQRVVGSSFADTLTGTATTVSLSGGAGGADTFNPGGGGTVAAQEAIAGSSSGNNTVTYATATAGVTVNLSTGLASGYGNQALSNIQKVVGSSFADTLTGTKSTLSLSGGAGGDDTFDGGGGNVTITGSSTGNNTVTFANDTAGAVTVNLKTGTVTGAYGNETLSNIQNSVGSSFSDTLTAGTTTRSLSGGAGGDDTFDGGGVNVTIIGSTTGSNTLTFANDTASGVTVNLQTGSVTGGYGTETVSNIQRVVGSSFADTLTGTATTVSLSGGTGGADTFNPGGGGTATARETIAGSSSGNNTVTYATATTGVTVNLATGLASGYGNQALSNIQKVVGSSFADTLTGTKSTLSLSGGAGGNDTFDAGSGGTLSVQETITGGSGGVNTLTYASAAAGVTVNLKTGLATGAGFQTISNIQSVVGSAFADTLTAGSATTSLSGGSGGNDTFDGGGANLTIIGSTTGSNTLTFANDTVSAVSVNLQTGSVTGGYGTETVSNIQRVVGSSFADTLTGAATTVSLSGGTGGADTFNPGGGGSAAVQETIQGSTSGQNTISYAGAEAGVAVNLATGRATGFGFQTISNIQKVIGSSFADTLTGSTTTVSLSGGSGGDDTFSPGAGGTSTAQETITGSSTGDNTVTYAGAAAVVVNMQTNRVTGSGFQTLANIQNVIGSANNDTFLASATTKSFDGGSGGNDTFDGGGFGTVSAPLLISGSASGVNTLTFSHSTGGVNVNLQTGAVTGAYGVETITRIQQVIGSKFADTITGVASGNATIDGGGGADNIIGGAGNNTLTFANAGAGGVVVNLQTGVATGYGTGTETISGPIQNIIGSAGNDVLTAGAGTLSLNGGAAGNDTFDGSAQGTLAAPLLLTGSAGGSNTVTFAHATGAVNVNLQTGAVTGAYGVETLSLIRNVIGSTFGDTITGVSSGSATIDAGGGADNITGGAGNNTLTYANAGAGGIVVNLQTGLATGYGSGTETISGAIQNVIGSAGADFMTAGTGTLSLSGGTAGNDTFDGGGIGTVAAPLVIAGSTSGTNNTLTFAASTGGVTANLKTGSVTGAYGVETVSRIQSVIGSAFADVITGSATATSLNGGTSGNDTFDGGGGNVVITGSTSGVNTLTFANDTAGGVVVNLQTHVVTGAYGNETVTNIHNVIGSSFSDVLTGTTTTLSLDGGTGGNDTFDGGGGGTVAAPLVITGSTSGTNVLTFANDTVAGDAGAVNVNLLSHAVTGGYGVETVTNIHNVIGSASGNDVIVGDNFGDSLTAGNGNVSITGGTGNDTIVGGTGNDTLFGGAGNDTLTAGAGIVTMTGGAGNDTLNATLATGGAILGGAGRAATDQDLAIVGPAFNTAMQTNAANNHIDLGAGVNTLQLNWQSAATTSYNFSTVSAAIRDVTTIDLTHNTAASSVTYTISAADIIAMTPAASVNLKLSSGDFLSVALTAGQTVAIGGGGATEVVKDASANIIATIHLT